MKNMMIVCATATVMLGCGAEETVRPGKCAVPVTLAGVPNLHKVADGLYRSAQPTAEGCGIMLSL
jgi:hypothetical protein